MEVEYLRSKVPKNKVPNISVYAVEIITKALIRIGSESQARGGKCDPCYSSPCLNGGFCITEDNTLQPRLSRAFRYCPAFPRHSGTAQPL